MTRCEHERLVGQVGFMREIALYYPYIHVQDDAWLKAAALYMPKLARLTPPNYPMHDSDVAKTLAGELDFFVNISPEQAPAVGEIADRFARFIVDNRKELQKRYQIEDRTDFENLPADVASGNIFGLHRSGDRGHAWIHAAKAASQMWDAIVSSGIGKVYARDGEDGARVILDSELAGIYMTALVERIAVDNHLSVVTDQPDLYGILSNWDFNTLASVLLDRKHIPAIPDDDNGQGKRNVDEVIARYVSLAVRTIIPADLEDIPVKRIVKARRTLGPEFDRFSAHLDSLTERFNELAEIRDDEVLKARLEILVDRELNHPAAEIKRGMRKLGLETTQATFARKSFDVPILTAVGTLAGAPPFVTEGGAAAVQFVTSGIQARADANELRRIGGPVGYFLGLKKQLTPFHSVDRLGKLLRLGRSRSQARRSAAPEDKAL